MILPPIALALFAERMADYQLKLLAVFSGSVALTALAAAAAIIYFEILKPLRALGRAAEPYPPAGETAGPYTVRTDDLKGLFGSIEKLIRSYGEISARHRALEDALRKPIFELDTFGGCVHANEKAEDLLGMDSAGLKDHPLSGFVEEGLRGEFNTFLYNTLKGGPPAELNTVLSSPDGRTVPVRLSAVQVLLGGVTTGLIVIAELAPEARKLTEELKRTKIEAEKTAERLRKTIDDLEGFALLAVRRELKMREIRERLEKMSERVDAGPTQTAKRPAGEKP